MMSGQSRTRNGHSSTFHVQSSDMDLLSDILQDAGLPRPYAEFLLLILGFFKAGYSERTTDAVAQILGRAPGSFEQYAKDYRAAWAA